MIQTQAVIFDRNKNENKIRMSSNGAKKKEGAKLDQLASGSARVLLEVRTVFPFNFFPDEVIIDEVKVSLHTSYFFYSREVRSIEYKDIFNIIAQESLVFGRLEIFDRYFSHSPFIVDFLWKSDAKKARRLIQGLIIAKKQNINTSIIPLDELMQKLNRIGESR